MTQKIINIGTADKGNGDPLRTAFSKVNDNFTEVYTNLNNLEYEQDLDGGAASTVFDDNTTINGGGA